MEKIRDATVAEAIAAEAGTDATPVLEMGDVVVPTIVLQPRPPLAASGYFPGTMGVAAAAVALNTTHVGLFGSGFGRAIMRINWILIMNNLATDESYTLRRLDAPFTGFPSVRLVPGYINAGNPTTGGAFSVTKSDTVAAQGVQLAAFRVPTKVNQMIPGPWVINDGALLVATGIVNRELRVMFGYEVWPAIRIQPPGG